MSKSNRNGFTLVELAIAFTVLSVLFLATLTSTIRGQKAFEASRATNAIEMRGQRALERIASELTMAGAGTLLPVPTAPLGGSDISFRCPTGMAAGAITWGSTTRIFFEADPNDPVNGLDDNRNGLVDEGRVVLVRDVGTAQESRVVLLDNVPKLLQGETANAADDNGNGLVDEPGFVVALVGGRLGVWLSCAGRDAENRMVIRTVKTSISLRN